MACLQIPPSLRISPLARRPLRFHYTGGAQCTLVLVDLPRTQCLATPAAPRAPLPALLAVVLAGCTSSPSSKSATPTVIAGGTAADGGTLTVGVWQAPTTLLDDGITGQLPFASVIAAPVEEGLLWYRSTAATTTSTSEADYWSPDLATSVPTVADGGVQTSGCADTAAAMCVTWHLRQGVRWDDGSSFTSHDVCDTVPTALARLRRARQDEPDAACLHDRVEPGRQMHGAGPLHGGRRLQVAVRAISRRSAAASTGSCPSAVLDPVLAAHGDLELSVDEPRPDHGFRQRLRVQGQRNARHRTRRHRTVRDVELYTGIPVGAGAQSQLLEPDRTGAPRQDHLPDRTRPRDRGEGREFRCQSRSD